MLLFRLIDCLKYKNDGSASEVGGGFRMGHHHLLDNIVPLPLRASALRLQLCPLHIHRAHLHNSRLHPLRQLLQGHLQRARIQQLPHQPALQRRARIDQGKGEEGKRDEEAVEGQQKEGRDQPKLNQFAKQHRVLLQMRPRQRAASAPLQDLQEVHPPHGPPLPLGRQLRWQAQPQVFHSLPVLRHRLSMVAITFTIDWWTGQFYASKLNDLQYYTYYFSCITSYMLASSIGFLFVTQMLTACRNITTLESFTEGVYEKNPFDRSSRLENLRQIFGSSSWFLPTDPFPTDCPLMNGTIDVL